MIHKDSILVTVKKMLNVMPEDQAFDTEIVLLINSEFMVLNQLGIGPKDGFTISDYDTKWTDYTSDKELIDALKIYVGMRVRMIFDPPASSIVAEAINSRIAELEFRLLAHNERTYIADHPEEFHHDDIFADDEMPDTNRKNYKLDGENLILFEKPKLINY